MQWTQQWCIQHSLTVDVRSILRGSARHLLTCISPATDDGSPEDSPESFRRRTSKLAWAAVDRNVVTANGQPIQSPRRPSRNLRTEPAHSRPENRLHATKSLTLTSLVLLRRCCLHIRRSLLAWTGLCRSRSGNSIQCYDLMSGFFLESFKADIFESTVVDLRSASNEHLRLPPRNRAGIHYGRSTWSSEVRSVFRGKDPGHRGGHPRWLTHIRAMGRRGTRCRVTHRTVHHRRARARLLCTDGLGDCRLPMFNSLLTHQ